MALIAIIPKMTSNTAPEGVASASSSLGTAFAPWRAFDQAQASLSTMQGGWLATSADSSPTLSYEFSSPTQLNSIYIETANNGTTLTVTAFIEGLINGVWENILYSGESVDLTFNQGAYTEYNIALNGNTYSAIRIRGNETWYKGVNRTACTISRMQAYYNDTPPVPPGPGFPVNIQRNNSESIHLDKDLTNILTTQAVLKSDTSLIDPVLLIEVDLATVALANYVTIPQFNRSYFITNIRSVTNDLVELTCHVDVLSSFAEEIRANTGIIRRNENDWNLYLNDGTLISYQNPIVTTQAFPSGFTEQSFVLVVAGSREGGVNVGEGGSTSVSPTESEEMGGAGNVNSKTTGGLVVYATQQLGKPYWFGTFGNTATQTLLEFKRNQYPSYFPDPGDPAFASQFGERVHDCVGLIKGYRWRENPTNADPVYTLSEDVDATGLYNQCIKHRGIVHPDTPAMEYPIGCVFFYAPDSNGNIQHCGVYIGNGNIIEARGHRYGVVQTNISQRTQFALWGIPDWMQVTTTYG